MEHDDNTQTRSPQHIKPIGFDQPGGGNQAEPAPETTSQAVEGDAETECGAEDGSPQHIKPIGFDQPGGGNQAEPAPETASQAVEGAAETGCGAEKVTEPEDEHGPGDKHERSYLPVGF